MERQMTRDEEILKAARAYVSGDTLSSPSILIHFENGAGWADDNPPQDVVNLNDVWHDANDKPHPKEWLLVQFGEDDYKALSLYGLYIDMWRDWCKIFHAIRWAYISDLLPKGGEK